MEEPVLLLIDVHALQVGREAIVHKVRTYLSLQQPQYHRQLMQTIQQLFTPRFGVPFFSCLYSRV